MVAPRFVVRIVLALMCVIFLLGCPLDIDKAKEDAYKQGYEQGLKDKSKTQVPSTDYWDDYLKQRSRESERLRQEYLQKQADDAKQLHDMYERQRLEDKMEEIQRLEDKIRQLELELRSERFKSESERIQRETELWYYKNQLKNQ